MRDRNARIVNVVIYGIEEDDEKKSPGTGSGDSRAARGNRGQIPRGEKTRQT